VFIGAEDGELAHLIDEGQCGFRVAPGDGQALADGIASLAAHPEVAQRQGLAARRLFEERFHRRLATDAWRRLLQTVADGHCMGGTGAVR
jgi:glycosyltransferase involved in cell wall biosynthesis